MFLALILLQTPQPYKKVGSPTPVHLVLQVNHTVSLQVQTTENETNEKHLTLVLSINFRWLHLQCTQDIRRFVFCFVLINLLPHYLLPHRMHRLVALCLLFYNFASEECNVSLSLSLNHYLMILVASI